jgi:hypothetical protein
MHYHLWFISPWIEAQIFYHELMNALGIIYHNISYNHIVSPP